VELAILLPVILLVLAFLVVGARIALAADRIAGVAGTAAREASLARTPTDADHAARDAAVAALSSAGLHCARITVATDTSGFSAPAGQPGTVTVDVWCTVELSDVAVPGLPGAKTLHDRAVSPVDTARSRP
jgi:Flp pilus assembly protein TadG